MPKASPLASASATREVLQSHGITAKKALGQHFLINDHIVEKTLELAGIGADDVVLEVGPGIGTLTSALLAHARKVVAVEADPDLVPVLADTLAPWRDRLVLIEKDALDLTSDDLGGCAPNKFAANLPYAVAATLVLDYFERFTFLDSATVMVQKEVADRMVAAPGTKSYGAYTVKLALFAQAGGRVPVSASNFLPPPHVDSALLHLDRRRTGFDAPDMPSREVVDAACTMADAAFANRRKTIGNSCRAYFSERGDAPRGITALLPAMFEEAGIDARRRGEELAPADFVRLGEAYLKTRGA